MTGAEIYRHGFIDLCILYAKMYQQDGKNWLTCYLKYPSIRSCSQMAVLSFKKSGAWEECEKRDFSEWVSKHNLSEKDGQVLNDILVIFWNLRPSPKP